jgi:hypothetical protein
VRGIGSSNSNVMKLFNGKTQNGDKNMWQANVPTLSYLEIVVKIPTHVVLSKVIIWNYNKNISVCRETKCHSTFYS